MTTYLITRHPGTRQWAEEEGIMVDALLDHLDVEQIQPGDVVIGTLPVHLAAEVCVRGGRYVHLTLELPFEVRGRELTPQDMRRFGARMEEFEVSRPAGACPHADMRPLVDENHGAGTEIFETDE
ncbi:MAG TPA: CRISPR-associated protein Csx16 [Methylococcus sp.]|nr:CRISPR-associated protein Csx16 [Methylococcus sp.]